MSKTLIYLLLFLNRKEDFMMAMLWAQQIMMKETIEEAKAMYKRVPRLLKEKVTQILVDSGMEEITK